MTYTTDRITLTFGTHVYCTDKECGKLAYVVVDPTTQQVTEIVVEYGLPFLKHNRVLPFATIRSMMADALHLTINSSEWDEYQEYREFDIEEPDPASMIRQPSLRTDGAIDYQGPMIHRHLRQGIPAERLILHASSPVKQQESTVGQVDHLLIEPATGRITHLALRRGLLQWEYIVVPVDQFILANDGSIQLNIPLSALEAFPHFQRPGEDALLVDVEEHLHDESHAFAGVHATMIAGVIHLTGHVRSRELKHHASELARTIPGVNAVQNEIQVGNAVTIAAPTDHIDMPTDEVAAAVSYALTADPRTERSAIDVRHDDGVVYLRGEVNSIAERYLAENLAAGQPGVSAVKNELTVHTERPEVRQPVAT